MTGLDAAVIAILLVSGLLALVRGFVNEVLSIVAWVIGAIAAVWLYPFLTPMLRGIVSPDWLAAAAAALIIFAVVYGVCHLFTNRLSARLHELHEHVGLLDRTLGFIFGIARGLVVVAIAFLFFAWLVPERSDHPDWIREARTLPLIESTSVALLALVPGDGTAFRPPEAAPEAVLEPTQSATDTERDKGYKPSERMGLDRLIESATDE